MGVKKLARTQVKKAYDILNNYKMLNRIIASYFGVKISGNIGIETFYAIIIENQSWLSLLNVFIDMDNTLAHFSNGKIDDGSVLEKAILEGFFENLPIMDDYINIYEALACIGVNIYILSACMNTLYCRKEKRIWLNKYMPWIKQKQIILCNVGENKSKIALTKANIESLEHSILIDDYKENLLNWLIAGGYAIKKAISYKPNRPYPTLINHKEAIDLILGTGLSIIKIKIEA